MARASLMQRKQVDDGFIFSFLLLFSFSLLSLSLFLFFFSFFFFFPLSSTPCVVFLPTHRMTRSRRTLSVWRKKKKQTEKLHGWNGEKLHVPHPTPALATPVSKSLVSSVVVLGTVHEKCRSAITPGGSPSTWQAKQGTAPLNAYLARV
jgi:hypothetical protein